MTNHMGGISIEERQHPKFFNMVFISLPYFEMLLHIIRVILVPTVE